MRRALLMLLALGAPLVSAGCASMGAEATPRDGGSPHDAQTGAESGWLGRLSTIPVDPKLNDEVKITSPHSAAERYEWTVEDPAGAPVAIEPSDASHASSITIKVSKVGTYQVRCLVHLANQQDVPDELAIPVTDPSVPSRVYRVRVTAPPDRPPMTKDVTVAMAGADRLGQVLVLDQGATRVQISWEGKSLDTQLRLYHGLGTDPAPHEVILTGGAGELFLPPSFRAIFFPLGSPAPAWGKTVQSATDLGATWLETPTAGVSVKGTVTRSGGEPLPGVAVSVAAPIDGLMLPSTPVITDSNGAFEVRTRAAQNAQLTFAPPVSSGLSVAVASVDVPAAGASNWSFAFDGLATTALSGTLARFGGGAAQPDGLLVLSRADAVEVGTLSLGGATVRAKGRFRYTLVVSGSAGELQEIGTGATSITIPAGTYKAEVWPGKAESPEQGYATTLQTLAAGTSKLALSLGKRVTLSGTLAAGASQILVMARALGDRSFIATTEGGAFKLTVDDKSLYTVTTRAQGAAGKRLAAAAIGQLQVDGDKSLASITLPPAVLYAGKLLTSSGQPVPRAALRIWCDDVSCPSREVLDETQTLNDGSFFLRIPAEAKKP